MQYLNKKQEEWGDFFTFLIEENGIGDYPYLLETKKKQDGYCIFFNSAKRTCKIHHVKPFSCVRFFCESIRKTMPIAQFFTKHGLATEYRFRESHFHTELTILFKVISFFKQGVDRAWIRWYLNTEITGEFKIELQKNEIDMLISLVNAYDQEIQRNSQPLIINEKRN